MAKNEENKKAKNSVENEAMELLRKLSGQYSADSVDREKKMADTLNSIPDDEKSENDRLSTKEFDRIFDKFSSEQTENGQNTAAPFGDSAQYAVSEDVFTQAAEKVDVQRAYETPSDVSNEAPLRRNANDDRKASEAPLRKNADGDRKTSDAPAQDISATLFRNVFGSGESAETSAEGAAQTEEYTEESVELTFADIMGQDAETYEDRADTNVFADRMVGEDTIASFEPSGVDARNERYNENVENNENENSEYEQNLKLAFAAFSGKEDVKKNTETSDLSETAQTDTQTMRAFGHDPRKEVERDDAKKIFEEYSFAGTGEMDDVPSGTTTSLDISTGSEVPNDSDAVAYEYTEPEQKKEIFAAFREKYMSQKIKMVVAGLFAVLLFVVEALPSMAKNFDIFSGNVIASVVVDICILVCSGALVVGSMAKSAKLLFKGKFNGDTVTLTSFVISFIISMVALVYAVTKSDETVTLYNFAFAICAFFSILFDFLSVRRDVYSFKIASASETKTLLSKLNRIERYAEEKEFGEYMGDYSDVYKAEETDFVADFFRKRNETSSSTNVLAFLIPISLLAAVVSVMLSIFVFDNSTVTGISHGFMAYCFCAPVTALISFVYPMYLSAQRAFSYNSAIIGDTTPEANDKVAAVVFSDSDAFPPERIKIKSVKVFENYHIENVIYYASSVFSKIGGPLSSVFKQATLDSLNSENVEIKEITDLGIDAFVDERHIVVGQPSYMESQCFETMYEAGDEEYEGQTNKRIMYLACDEVVVAKFYIQYNVSPDFLYIVRHLSAEGICVSVRSSDPCVDNDILYRNKIDPTELPVRVIKGQGPNEKKESISTSVGSIVSTGSKKGLIKTLLLCDKILNIRKTNLIVKIFSMVMGMVATGFLVTATAPVSSLFPALYQTFWMLPIFIVAKIYI